MSNTVTTTNGIVVVKETTGNTVTVSSVGLQGAQGIQGPSGSASNSGSFATTGSNTFTGNQIVTGSVNISGSLTATLTGTASFATTASYIPTLRATGSNTYIQFNNNGLLGASLAFAVDDFNGALYVRNQPGQDGGNIIITSRFGEPIYLGNIVGGNTSLEVGLYSLNGDEVIATSDLSTYKYSNGFYQYDNPNTKHTFTGSVNISSILTLDPQHPLPLNTPTGSFAVSSSNPPKPYFWDGGVWNPLY